jgi:hypothetical protein
MLQVFTPPTPQSINTSRVLITNAVLTEHMQELKQFLIVYNGFPFSNALCSQKPPHTHTLTSTGMHANTAYTPTHSLTHPHSTNYIIVPKCLFLLQRNCKAELNSRVIVK